MAIERINKILNCSRGNIEINKDIFQEDFDQTKNSYKEASRNRKSFWIHLTKPLDDPKNNYCNACYFFERQYSLDEEIEIEKYKELITSNRDKANAIDLFRLCSMRQKMHNI